MAHQASGYGIGFGESGVGYVAFLRPAKTHFANEASNYAEKQAFPQALERLSALNLRFLPSKLKTEARECHGLQLFNVKNSYAL